MIFTEPSKKTGSDYVVALERKDFKQVTRQLTQVALQAIQDDFEANVLSFPEWQALERRVAAIQERLIDADRWDGVFS